MVSASELEQTLKERVPAEEVLIEDQSGGCGAKFSIVVVSSVFEGKSLLQRHRIVNDCIKEELNDIHALSMRTWTPEQWLEKKSSFTFN